MHEGVIVVRQRQGITIDGVTIDASMLTNMSLILSYGPNRNITVRNSRLTGCHDAGYPNCWGIATDGVDTGLQILGNQFLDIGTDPAVPLSEDGRQRYGISYG